MERNDIEASINAAYAEKNSETSKMEMFALNKILLVEDDIHISEVIHDYFVRESGGQMYVEVAYNGDDGLDSFMMETFDLVLLDIMLPGMDGFAVCREMRRNSMVPILFLTARDSERDIMLGYDLGCDDYIVKPFSLATLYAKCKTLIKRSKGTDSNGELVCGAISMNPSRYMTKVNGVEVDLAPKEFALLKILLENKGKVITRERLLVDIWGYDYEGSDRCVDNHVRKLRAGIGSAGKQIKTVIGKGYQVKEI